MNRLPLPRFTFLIGPRDAGHGELTKAIAETDRYLAVEDFEEPLRDAMFAVFFNGYQSWLPDFRELDHRVHKIVGTSFTVDDVLIFQKKMYMEFGGKGILGQLAIQRVDQNDFEHSIFRDCNMDDLEAIRVMIERYGRENCLIIWIGPIGANPFAGVKSIWLAVRGVTERMAMLKKELNCDTGPNQTIRADTPSTSEAKD